MPPPSGDIFSRFKGRARHREKFSQPMLLRTICCYISEKHELWSNHGPRIGANPYFIRFWEAPASRIFFHGGNMGSNFGWGAAVSMIGGRKL